MNRLLTKQMRDSFKADAVKISYLVEAADGKIFKTIKKKLRILILKRTIK